MEPYHAMPFKQNLTVGYLVEPNNISENQFGKNTALFSILGNDQNVENQNIESLKVDWKFEKDQNPTERQKSFF